MHIQKRKQKLNSTNEQITCCRPDSEPNAAKIDFWQYGKTEKVSHSVWASMQDLHNGSIWGTYTNFTV